MQGGQGLMARKPLYDDGADGSPKFWGFATIILDFTTLTSLFPDQDRSSHHQYALRT
jgi:sensor domain CHASE-containing protein